VQQTEVGGLAAAWGRVKAIVVENPRLGKPGLRTEKLKEATPELFKEVSPVEPLSTFVLTAAHGALYHEVKEFGSSSNRTLVGSIDAVPFEGLLDRQNRLLWEHNGECGCGRRTYLFGQCMKCLEDELHERRSEEQQVAFGEKEVPQVSIPGGFPYPDATAASIFPALQLPEVREGADTGAIRFVHDEELLRLATEAIVAQEWDDIGWMVVNDWKTGSFDIPKYQFTQWPFRIAFVVFDKRIIPLQQCVDCRREIKHNVLEKHREPGGFCGFHLTGFIPVLDELLKNSKTEVVKAAVPAKLSNAVSISLDLVSPVYVVQRKKQIHATLQEIEKSRTLDKRRAWSDHF
jgi:hypothetical protein